MKSVHIFALLLCLCVSAASYGGEETNAAKTQKPADEKIATDAKASGFKDIPTGHWAAESVKKISELGIMKGFPDGEFKGDAPITRYELAVTLDRFIKMIQESRKPAASANKPAASKSANTKTPKWAAGAIESLTDGGYIPKNSPILADGSKPVSAEELANALASVAAKIIENDVLDAGAPEPPR